MAEQTPAQGQGKCAICGLPVVKIAHNDVVVHVGGGSSMQKCKNQTCGWTGGQAGGFTTCPRCGDATSLVTDHVATL